MAPSIRGGGVRALSRVIWRSAIPACCVVCALFLLHLRVRAGGSLAVFPLRPELRSITLLEHVAPAAPAPTRTVRTGCREYSKGAQSCVFEGVACVETNAQRSKGRVRPLLYLVDDTRRDGEVVSSDRWCNLRHKSADPRYFGPRDWPIRRDLFAPMWSCLDARFRTLKSLFPNGTAASKIRWLDDFSLIDLDYVNNDHNNHYLKDTVWLLDVALWQRALTLSSTSDAHRPPVLFPPPTHVFMPQTRADFLKQTGRDVNRINLALILRLDPAKLYNNVTVAPGASARVARPLLDAYPSLGKKLVFYGDARADNATELVCTRRLTVGAKLGDFGDERVCQHMRMRSWELFGIKEPRIGRSGFLQFPQPPKRVVLLQRHRTRKFARMREMEAALRNASRRYGFELEITSTAVLKTAEDHVRFFSRVGVLLTPHGSQAMGGMWMPRHAALIEVFPPGYTDFAFNLLSQACNLWYYELQGIVVKHLEETYRTRCGKKMNSIFDQCVQVKNADVVPDVDEVVKTVITALRKLGHDVVPKY